MKETLKTVALFIDADNVPVTAIPGILEILLLEWIPIKMHSLPMQDEPEGVN